MLLWCVCCLCAHFCVEILCLLTIVCIFLCYSHVFVGYFVHTSVLQSYIYWLLWAIFVLQSFHVSNSVHSFLLVIYCILFTHVFVTVIFILILCKQFFWESCVYCLLFTHFCAKCVYLCIPVLHSCISWLLCVYYCKEVLFYWLFCLHFYVIVMFILAAI